MCRDFVSGVITRPSKSREPLGGPPEMARRVARGRIVRRIRSATQQTRLPNGRRTRRAALWRTSASTVPVVGFDDADDYVFSRSLQYAEYLRVRSTRIVIE